MMAYTLEIVDWRDGQGTSYPRYFRHQDSWKRVGASRTWTSRRDAEIAAERAWIEPDCNGVAPVCVVTECVLAGRTLT